MTKQFVSKTLKIPVNELNRVGCAGRPYLRARRRVLTPLSVQGPDRMAVFHPLLLSLLFDNVVLSYSVPDFKKNCLELVHHP